ncbi:hypothetical protein D3C85_1660480 [compost metagenome]
MTNGMSSFIIEPPVHTAPDNHLFNVVKPVAAVTPVDAMSAALPGAPPAPVAKLDSGWLNGLSQDVARLSM